MLVLILLENSASSSRKLAEQPAKFIPILLSGAFSDSINPCAFAVMLLLLTTILSKSKSKKDDFRTSFLFGDLWFVFSYGAWVFGVAFTKTTQYTSAFKRIVGIFGILIGLANIKDYFWYGKGFVMEVPRSWRPK